MWPTSNQRASRFSIHGTAWPPPDAARRRLPYRTHAGDLSVAAALHACGVLCASSGCGGARMSQIETPATPVQGELDLYAPPAHVEELLVPARMVNEWVYCPRLAFLEWAHGEWAGNADTAAGDRAHAATEAGRAPPLPAPGELPDAGSLKTRRLSLASERLGLAAEIDVLEAE